LSGDASINYTQEINPGLWNITAFPFMINNNASGFLKVKMSNGGELISDHGDYLVYTCIFDGKINIGIYCDYGATYFVYIYQNGIRIYEKTINSDPYVVDINEEIDVIAGDEIGVIIDTVYAVNFRNAEASVSFTPIRIDHLAYFSGLKLNLSTCIGFATAFDFFKAITQAFGLTVEVNESTKQVRAYTFNKLYDNKPVALDWSNKVTSKNGSINFDAPFGQKNYITLKENQDEKISDQITFHCDDNTLAEEKKLFDLPFEAGTDVRSEHVSLLTHAANIPVITIEEGNKFSLKKLPPHIVWDTGESVNVEIVPGKQRDYHTSLHLTGEDMKNIGYAVLENKLLKSYAMLDEEEILLTPQDIQDFDPFMPVYIEKYGYYFYVNKIKNFVAGKATKVELVKL
jgi:hypothetical protein